MPVWSKEQVEYLEDKWGSLSITTIAKNLNRSVNAVKIKAYKLGLGRHLHSGDYITLNQLCKALGLGQSYTENFKRWSNNGLPVKKKKVINNSFRVIYLKDFWKWAEPNKMLINFSRVERHILGPEPAWVDEKRKADFLAGQYKKTPWTPAEDALFIQMLKAYRYSYREISIKLKRTEGALKRRMKDLGLKQRPLRADNHNPWTDEEIKILVDLYYKGYISEVMAEKIPRSALAINGKIERMIKDGELSVKRVDPMQEETRLRLAKAGISYKKALPEEAWPNIRHFLGEPSHYADTARKQNNHLNVGAFLNTYARIYGSENRRAGDVLCLTQAQVYLRSNTTAP